MDRVRASYDWAAVENSQLKVTFENEAQYLTDALKLDGRIDLMKSS